MIKELKQYIKSVRFDPNGIVVEVEFKNGWTIVPSDKFLVHQVSFNETNNTILCIIYSEVSDDIDLDEFIEYIKKLVDKNKERELKEELLTKKIAELTTIFTNSSLEQVKLLEFKFAVPKIKSPNVPLIEND